MQKMHPYFMISKQYRYTLEKGSRKYYCPSCGKKRFVRFVDNETGEYLPKQYGRCDKGDGHYFLDPRKDGYSLKVWQQENNTGSHSFVEVKKRPKVLTEPKETAPAFFPFEVYQNEVLREGATGSTFYENLNNWKPKFPTEDLNRVFELYQLGAIKKGYMGKGVCFPFIDIENRLRAVQVKEFDNENHTIKTSWLHSLIARRYKKESIPIWLKDYIESEKKVSCLFGEYLLKRYPNNPVALVEAPKTAIYGALYFGLPESPENPIWLAVFNKSSFKLEKLKVLKGRKVVLYPDLGATEEWKQKAQDFNKQIEGANFITSELLVRQVGKDQPENKLSDLADFLELEDWRTFRPQPKKQIEPPQDTTPKEKQQVPIEVKEDPEKWPIQELRTFFNKVDAIDTPLKFQPYGIILDFNKYVETHLSYIQFNEGKEKFKPYLNRLIALKTLIESL